MNACFCSRVDMFAEKRPRWQESDFLSFFVFFSCFFYVAAACVCEREEGSMEVANDPT